MSRNRKHDKKGKGGSTLSSFIGLERYILNSPAWRDLSAMARAAYIEVAAGYTGDNNGKIAFGSRALGQKLNTVKATAARALVELQEHGFIECMKKGGFVCKVRHASEWRLTAFKCDVTGQLPLKPFMHWKPKIQKSVSPARPYGITHETVGAKSAPQMPPRYHQRDREGHFKGVHGITSETLLYSSHRQADTNSMPSADPAHSEAGAKRLSDNGTPDGIFISAGLAALKSLGVLDQALPSDLKSWATHPSKLKVENAA